MKFLHFFPVAATLCVSLLLTGCVSVETTPPKAEKEQDYYRVTTADFQGKRIAEFVSEGPVKRTEDGFTFWAVQRRIFEPEIMEFHYPLGRTVTVAASNTVSIPTRKPEWLVCLDHSWEGKQAAVDGQIVGVAPSPKPAAVIAAPRP